MGLLELLFGVIFLTGLVVVTTGMFRLLFHALGCLLILPVLVVLFTVFATFASVLFVPALFLMGLILVLVGFIKLIA